MADTPKYRARGNEIIDANGQQVAVIVPTTCTKKLAREMAAAAAIRASASAEGDVFTANQMRDMYMQGWRDRGVADVAIARSDEFYGSALQHSIADAIATIPDPQELNDLLQWCGL